MDGYPHPQLLLCTGKKKSIEKLDAYIKSLEAKKEVHLAARHQVTKSKLLRSFEEVRILMFTKDMIFEVDPAVMDSLDHFVITDKGTIAASMSTFKETDMWLRWSIKEQTAHFQLRGGELTIREEKERQANGAVVRVCHYKLMGELKLVTHYRDRLLEHKLADPKTIQYSF